MVWEDGAPFTGHPSYPITAEFHVAGTSLLALIDDIASILDDIALMSKVAAKKPAKKPTLMPKEYQKTDE